MMKEKESSRRGNLNVFGFKNQTERMDSIQMMSVLHQSNQKMNEREITGRNGIERVE
jgi:hypothetical protein